jgi:hypothetical protein
MFTSKKANPVRVYAAAPTKSKSTKPPAFSNIINEDNESKVYEEMMEQQLREITKLKMNAIERIPAKVNPIVCLLQMPNVEAALSSISQNLKLKKCYGRLQQWKTFTYHERQLQQRREHCMLKVGVFLQKRWRGCKGRLHFRDLVAIHDANEKTRKYQAAVAIQSVFLLCKYKRRALQRLLVLKERHLVNCATKIQQTFRGYFARGLIIDKERILLIRALRHFAHGNFEKLLRRSGDTFLLKMCLFLFYFLFDC